MKIFIDQYLLEMPQVRSITRDICDGIDFFQSEQLPTEDKSWTLAWGYPATKRRFGVAETGFFWDAMHIDTQGLYQFSSLNNWEGRNIMEQFAAPVSAKDLIEHSSLPKSKYRQPKDQLEWKGVVFASQNPTDRSVHSVAASEDWWRFYEDSCKYYGSRLFVKLHPWNSGETEVRMQEIAKSHGASIGKVGHSIIEKCEHVVLFNSTFSVDCMLRGIPVKQGAPGYFYQTGAVTYCAGNPRLNLQETINQAYQLTDFLMWKYCFSMDCSLEDWKRLLKCFACSHELFPLRYQDSYGAYLQSKLKEKTIPTNVVNQQELTDSTSLKIKTNNSFIPKIFHIIWLGNNPIPDQHKIWLEEWKNLHPDWQVMYWGNEVEHEIPVEYKTFYHQSRSWSGKSDIARLAVIKKYGGIYHDTDYRPLRAIDPLLASCQAFVTTERKGGRLTGSIFGAIPQHPFITALLQKIPEVFQPDSPMHTGPLLFDSIRTMGRDDVRIFERKLFTPVLPNRRKSALTFADENSYAVHTFAGSWNEKRQQNQE